jgi:amino acid permease
MMFLHKFVPDAFGLSISWCHWLKEMIWTRPMQIIIVPLLSARVFQRSFEMCLVHGMESWLKVGELQFGFKKGRE